MQHHALTERLALSETLRVAGPSAPTLCGDWTTAQLAAHLVLRERSVVEAAGRFPVPRLQRAAARVVADHARSHTYAELVAAVGRGPSWRDVARPVPVAWLWALPPVREQANLLEYLVHHEDVRRATDGWQPRVLDATYRQAVWTRLHVLARVTMRRVPVGVVLRSPDHGRFRARRGERTVVVTGDPVELALLALGRVPQARVEFDGAPDDVAAVRTADLSF